MPNGPAGHESATASALSGAPASERCAARIAWLVRVPKEFIVNWMTDVRYVGGAFVLYLTGMDRLAHSLCWRELLDARQQSRPRSESARQA